MRRFKSQGPAQRFLFSQGVANKQFQLGRHPMKASHNRALTYRSFVGWGRGSCVESLA